MDKYAQRETRLRILAQKIAQGTITEEERAEYERLENEQSQELLHAVEALAKKRVWRFF